MKFKALYDDLYKKGYHKDPNFTHSTELIAYIRKLLPKGNRILDVGCSLGKAVSVLQKKGYDCHGIDISQVAINKLVKRGIKKCRCSSACDIKHPDGKFDAILSTDVLEHVPKDEIDQVAAEFDRVVRDKGYLFLKIAKGPEILRKFDHVTKRHGLKDLHVTTRGLPYWMGVFGSFQRRKVLRNTEKFIELILKKA